MYNSTHIVLFDYFNMAPQLEALTIFDGIYFKFRKTSERNVSPEESTLRGFPAIELLRCSARKTFFLKKT